MALLLTAVVEVADVTVIAVGWVSDFPTGGGPSGAARDGSVWSHAAGDGILCMLQKWLVSGSCESHDGVA